MRQCAGWFEGWLVWVGVMGLIGLACARPLPPPGDAPAALDFRSSPAVLLAHRDALALTPLQVERLEQLDFIVHEKNVGPHQELESLREQARKSSRPWHGGYQGGGLHDVHGGKGGSVSEPPDEARARLRRRERLERMEALLRAMQDTDSQAYLTAEELMSDTQRPLARRLITQEREALLKQLDALHYRLRKGDY